MHSHVRVLFRHLFLAFLVAITAASSASARVWYVRIDLDSGENDGTSWPNAFSGPLGLQSALAIAQNGDQIWVAQGTYHPAAVGQRTVSFVIPNGVEVFGGFAGNETSLDQRDPQAHVTILSGDLAENGSATGQQADNSFHVVKVDNAYDPTTLDGFTIRGGMTDCCTPAQANGAGMQLSRTLMTVRNCRFEQNDADSYGGDISITNASPLIESCVFTGTSVARRGLAIFHTGSSNATIRGCQFIGAPMTTGGSAGVGIFNESPLPNSITVEDCYFSMRTRDFSCPAGVGITVWTGAKAVINRCDFINNFTCGGGGGVYVAGTATIDRCRFINNEGQFDGGAALFTIQGSTTVTNSTFIGNSKTGFNTVMAQGPIMFANCTFASNGRTNMSHTTIQATVPGTTLTNCILWNNKSSQGDASAVSFLSTNGIRPRFDYSLVQNWPINTVPSTGSFAADPRFVSLLGTDGLLGTLDDNVHLRADSPCIDRGTTLVPLSALDLDGNPRVQDEPRIESTGMGTGAIDLGAYERGRPSRSAVQRPTPRPRE